MLLFLPEKGICQFCPLKLSPLYLLSPKSSFLFFLKRKKKSIVFINLINTSKAFNLIYKTWIKILFDLNLLLIKKNYLNYLLFFFLWNELFFLGCLTKKSKYQIYRINKELKTRFGFEYLDPTYHIINWL